MKETEFRSRFIGTISPDHVPPSFIIEKRTSGFNSKWKEVARPRRIGNATAESELKEYMQKHLNVEPTKDDSAYARIKRL